MLHGTRRQLDLPVPRAGHRHFRTSPPEKAYIRMATILSGSNPPKASINVEYLSES